MPTIDDLAPAVVAADTDTLLVSQGGTSRRVTRAQLLAGTQTQITLGQGLLGRSGPGVGPLQQINVGGGLRLIGGVLSCSAPFTVAGLNQVTSVAPTDTIPVSTGGSDRAISVAALMSSPGADVSGQLVQSETGIKRALRDWVGDDLSVEAFGAVGDGLTDDSAAFSLAVASGRPIRLGAKVYRLDGQWTVSGSVTLLGIPGASVLRRVGQSGGAWISVVGPRFSAFGVIFDAGQVTSASWGVLVQSTCSSSCFDTCSFINSAGGALGTGLTIEARDGLVGPGSTHDIRHCTFAGNVVHGLWVQAANGATIADCRATGNGGYGICVDFNDAAFRYAARNCSIIGCHSSANQRGISIGNFNETNTEPPRWGLLNPDARDIVVVGNVCTSNSAYGIAAAGDNLQIAHNQVSTDQSAANASGILLNASRSKLLGNHVTGPGGFGIDAGGCEDCELLHNTVTSFSVGLNVGGGQDVNVFENRLRGNGRAITAFNVETDGSGQNFGLSCDGLVISRNSIELNATDSGGIYLVDGPTNVVVSDNRINSDAGASDRQALHLATDSVSVRGNLWNESPVGQIGSGDPSAGGMLIFSDIYDKVRLTAPGVLVTGMMSANQSATSGSVCFIRVVSGGSAYTRAVITIIGEGSGAAASAFIRDGAVIGVALLSAGSGYLGSTTTVSIVGDGIGAAATAFVGSPTPINRRLAVSCSSETVFQRAGSAPFQDNWTGSDLRVPGGTTVTWQENAGAWDATTFQNVNFVRPEVDGSVTVASDKGVLNLQTSSGAQVRFRSTAEQSGYLSCLGRGSPEGNIAAPAGSDYRNLDGGVGATFWIKTSGVNATGWTPIG